MTERAPTVSLVIPGRDCEATLDQCLGAVAPRLDDEASPLCEILFVDDGSVDGTAAIAAKYPVEVLAGGGNGPAAARNAGWRRARGDLVWFVDSDCVAEADALARLLPHLEDERVGGVSGTYANAAPESLLACLIHEEIRARHVRMPTRVDFLATFNVLYRRRLLEELDGFDVRYKKAQDAELAMRAVEAGWELHFEDSSRVAHFHETRWLGYLRTQRHQGFWRVWLHLERRGHAGGDSYSRLGDHLQPPLAMLVLAATPLLLHPVGRWICVALAVALFALTLPMTFTLVRRTGRIGMLAFAPLAFLRAFWRGIGMSLGTLDVLLKRRRRVAPPPPGA